MKNYNLSSIFYYLISIQPIIARQQFTTSNNIKMKDILSEKFMPTSIFLLQNEEISKDNLNLLKNITTLSGDFRNAFSTMDFHRQKFNEYLCNDFLVKKVFSDISNRTINFQRRLGTAPYISSDYFAPTLKSKSIKPAQEDESYLNDEGSSSYKKWLSRMESSQIDHYPTNNKTLDSQHQRNTNMPSNRRQGFESEIGEDDEEYEEGDVTGFAVHQNIPDFTSSSSSSEQSDVHNTLPDIMPYRSIAGSKHGIIYPSGQASNDAAYGVQDSNQKKEIGLKDIMDIALVTLAYLSFGMFILQVLMCITMSKTDNNLMMMPMENGDENVEGIVEEIRKRRSLPNNNIVQINQLSRSVLITLEATVYAKVDNAKCLKRFLCENNSFARKQKNGQKIWLPVWGLGLTWLTSKILSTQSSAALKASIFGLGNANCSQLYPECNFSEFSAVKNKIFNHQEFGKPLWHI